MDDCHVAVGHVALPTDEALRLLYLDFTDPLDQGRRQRLHFHFVQEGGTASAGPEVLGGWQGGHGGDRLVVRLQGPGVGVVSGDLSIWAAPDAEEGKAAVLYGPLPFHVALQRSSHLGWAASRLGGCLRLLPICRSHALLASRQEGCRRRKLLQLLKLLLCTADRPQVILDFRCYLSVIAEAQLQVARLAFHHFLHLFVGDKDLPQDFPVLHKAVGGGAGFFLTWQGRSCTISSICHCWLIPRRSSALISRRLLA
mmetsp:Transcript_969/g.2974  ORF Transcript_969/g.2974 Transcript_969/m.2974 type:complete len:255 (-) Transcript_969:105-869(-)